MLYLGDKAERHVNLSARGRSPHDIYLLAAVTLARSAATAGMSFALITNSKARIEATLRRHGLAGVVDVIEHRFTLQVPPGIAFHSAHFKLDLLTAFGRGAFGALVGLVDLDIVLQGPVELPYSASPAATGDLYVYDITDHVVPTYGSERISRDLAALAGLESSDPHWYGGEFIAGDPAGFAALSREIAAIWPTYCASVASWHHVGDEMLVSAALLRLMQAPTSSVGVREVGADGLISRWWSSRSLSSLEPLSQAIGSTMLHLPADKLFSAKAASVSFDAARFRHDYIRYAKRQRSVAILKNIVDSARRRPARSLPVL